MKIHVQSSQKMVDPLSISLGEVVQALINLARARGEMVIVVGNEHGDSSSNPGRG